MQGSKKCHLVIWASTFSFSLARWARDQASHQPTESLKEQARTVDLPNLRDTCPNGKLQSETFFSPAMIVTGS